MVSALAVTVLFSSSMFGMQAMSNGASSAWNSNATNGMAKVGGLAAATYLVVKGGKCLWNHGYKGCWKKEKPAACPVADLQARVAALEKASAEKKTTAETSGGAK